MKKMTFFHKILLGFFSLFWVEIPVVWIYQLWPKQLPRVCLFRGGTALLKHLSFTKLIPPNWRWRRRRKTSTCRKWALTPIESGEIKLRRNLIWSIYYIYLIILKLTSRWILTQNISPWTSPPTNSMATPADTTEPGKFPTTMISYPTKWKKQPSPSKNSGEPEWPWEDSSTSIYCNNLSMIMK